MIKICGMTAKPEFLDKEGPPFFSYIQGETYRSHKCKPADCIVPAMALRTYSSPIREKMCEVCVADMQVEGTSLSGSAPGSLPDAENSGINFFWSPKMGPTPEKRTRNRLHCCIKFRKPKNTKLTVSLLCSLKALRGNALKSAAAKHKKEIEEWLTSSPSQTQRERLWQNHSRPETCDLFAKAGYRNFHRFLLTVT